jgi:hypothetical protein
MTAFRAPAGIWPNESPGSNDRIELCIRGTKSNRDAIGALIEVVPAPFSHVTTAAGIFRPVLAGAFWTWAGCHD